MNKSKALNVVFVNFSQIEDKESYKAEQIQELIKEHPTSRLQDELEATFIFDQKDADAFLRVQRAKGDKTDPNTIFIVTLNDENEQETVSFLTTLHNEFQFQRVASIDWREGREEKTIEDDNAIWGKRIDRHWRNFWGIVKDTLHHHFFDVLRDKGFFSELDCSPRRAGERR
ncbi:MAG TPA: hypothetical protein PK957_03475 [Candidatus Dojkabacteria bacterium]|nr:hypothetical protein [Candidatus Dojkabacteria bacterium]HQF36793.1 hypothetical protein [Candidatus Dojkabacteria bacterium]